MCQPRCNRAEYIRCAGHFLAEQMTQFVIRMDVHVYNERSRQNDFPLERESKLAVNFPPITLKFSFTQLLKYYLKHEHKCFIRYNTRGAAERFISDKARIASVLNSFKNDLFYTHLVTLFKKEF